MSQTRCDVLTATSLATEASVAKQQQNVNGVGKINMKSSVMDSGYAPAAMALMLHLPKIARSGRRIRRLNALALKNASPFLKPASWQRRNSRQLV